MDVQHLEAFVAVADELHFGRAAHRLYVSQSALSRHIQTLETQLSVKLFERSNRRVRLTPAGEELHRRLPVILDQLKQVLTDVGRTGEYESTPSLTLGMVSGLPPELLEHLLLTAEAVGIRLLPSGMSGNLQLEPLRDGRLDLGLLRESVHDAQLSNVPVHRERRGIAVAAGHRLAKRASISAADLDGEPLLLFPRATAPHYYDRTLELLASRGYQPTEILTSDDPAQIVSMVALGLGVSLRPRAQVHRQPDVVWLPLEDLEITVETVLAWRRSDDRPSRLIAALRKRPHASMNSTRMGRVVNPHGPG